MATNILRSTRAVQMSVYVIRVFVRMCEQIAANAAILKRLAQEPVPYLPVAVAGLDAQMPYVCLRVPTGGGKTLLACYAAGLAMNEFMHVEHAVVLWLVPSNTMLDQTADALRHPRHPYRRALEFVCSAVEVATIAEALRLSRAAVEGQTVVIVDEAHNARTPLPFSTLGDVRPSCIIEFTATAAREPNPSNVLHHVSAAELKAASTVKLPLRVITRHPSQRDELLAESITLRSALKSSRPPKPRKRASICGRSCCFRPSEWMRASPCASGLCGSSALPGMKSRYPSACSTSSRT